MNSSNSVKIAMIGVGRICRMRHIPCFKKLRLSVVHAVDEKLESRLYAASEFPGISLSETMVDIPKDVNVALVATPPALHYEQTKYLLQKGISVFCEKPLCCTKPQAEELLELAQGNSTVLQVGYFRRFHPAAKAVASLLKSQSLGELRECLAFAGNCIKSSSLPPSSFMKELSGGGVLTDSGCHTIDRLYSWFDDMALEAYYDDSESGIEASAVIQASGRLRGVHFPVRIEVSRTQNLGYYIVLKFDRWNVRVDDNEGHLVHLLSEPDSLQLSGRQFTLSRDLILERKKPESVFFEHQWNEFVSRVNGEAERLSSLADAIRTTAMIHSCYLNRKKLRTAWESQLWRWAN